LAQEQFFQVRVAVTFATLLKKKSLIDLDIKGVTRVACGRSRAQHLPSLFCQYQIRKNDRCRGQYERQLAIGEEAEVGGHFEEGGDSNSETGCEPASMCWKTRESKATTVRKVEVQA